MAQCTAGPSPPAEHGRRTPHRAGTCAAIGYAVGTAVGWGGRRIGLRAPWPERRRPLVRWVAAAPALAAQVPDMAWFPVAAFFRVTIDFFVAGQAPAGHGHTHVGESADAWAAVAPPAGWTPAATSTLRTLLDEPQGSSIAAR